MGFEKDIQNITHLIAEKYHRGVDGNWLKGLIEEYHHPNINFRGGNPADEYLLFLPDTEVHGTRHPLPQKAGSTIETI